MPAPAPAVVPGPEYYTPGEIARRLNVSEGLIKRIIQRQELPAVKVGREWRVKIADFEGWLERISSPGTPTA